jgi:hypothetical protein
MQVSINDRNQSSHCSQPQSHGVRRNGVTGYNASIKHDFAVLENAPDLEPKMFS